MTMQNFPPSFLWGAATAAAQIEGAGHLDGKTDSVWDAFARIPGAIAGGDDLEVAVDHYHRYREDVAILKQLGLDAYRFSASWSRVRPDGGAVNPAGVAFYDRLVDELLGSGIDPWLTLYHWDLPQALEERGGWANRETSERFVEYVQTMHDALGDRVKNWSTFNEPFCSSLLGYASGVHAPGRQEPRAAVAAIHHQHVAHGLAVQALRRAGVTNLGITLNLSNAIPLDPSDPVDLEAARRFDVLQNRVFLDPIFAGGYAADTLEDLAPFGLHEVIKDGDLESISAPLDFLGVNHYHDDQVSGYALEGADGHGGGTDRPAASPWVGVERISFPHRELAHTGMGWEINPDGLRHLLVRLGREYPGLPPMYVTENGAAFPDEVSEDGHVHDAERTAYIVDHLDAVSRAIGEGADVRGYFVWSLLDNFEWSYGYEQRFGIVRASADGPRILKDSALAYARIAAQAIAGRERLASLAGAAEHGSGVRAG
jgi:beta-glucosidase